MAPTGYPDHITVTIPACDFLRAIGFLMMRYLKAQHSDASNSMQFLETTVTFSS
jgi:hypothetical protein